MEECLDLTEAPVARGVVSALHSREFTLVKLWHVM